MQQHEINLISYELDETVKIFNYDFMIILEEQIFYSYIYLFKLKLILFFLILFHTRGINIPNLLMKCEI